MTTTPSEPTRTPDAAPVRDYARPGVVHGPAGPAEFIPGCGWVRACLCGREFESHEDWQHVPALFDHISTAGRT